MKYLLMMDGVVRGMLEGPEPSKPLPELYSDFCEQFESDEDIDQFLDETYGPAAPQDETRFWRAFRAYVVSREMLVECLFEEVDLE